MIPKLITDYFQRSLKNLESSKRIKTIRNYLITNNYHYEQRKYSMGISCMGFKKSLN